MKKKELNEKLGIANNTVYKQMNHIEILNSQLLLMDKVIERKDREYDALKKMYRDDLINGDI